MFGPDSFIMLIPFLLILAAAGFAIWAIWRIATSLYRIANSLEAIAAQKASEHRSSALYEPSNH